MVQGYAGVTLFGAAVGVGNDGQIPTLEGAQVICPESWNMPNVLGNYWAVNTNVGAQNPVMDVPLLVRDIKTEALSANFLAYFMTRGTLPANDTPYFGLLSGLSLGGTYGYIPYGQTSAYGIAFWDGATGWVLNGAKAESYTLGTSWGDDIRLTTRFTGTGLTVLNAAPGVAAFDNTTTLRFNAVTFTGGLSDIVWSFDLSYANNTTPAGALNGTNFPAAQNAGMRTVGLNLRVEADQGVPGDLTAIVMQVAGVNGVATFTVNSPRDNTPKNRRATFPRVFRDHQYSCFGVDGQSTPPLTVASTF